MDSLQRRLVELNQALLKLNAGEKVDPKYLEQAQRVLAGGTIDTGPGNDTVIINKNIHKNGGDCSPGPQGPQGPQGPTGPSGPSSDCDCDCNAILVSDDYEATSNDCYIGVNSEDPVTITLPANCTMQKIVIKAEMGPPLGNRKVTIKTSDGSTIDGDDEVVLEVPYQSVQLFCRDGNWLII
jgi:hypothetical protein